MNESTLSCACACTLQEYDSYVLIKRLMNHLFGANIHGV